MVITSQSPNSPITVALLSRSRLVRSGMRSVLLEAPHIDLVGEAISAADAQGLIAQCRPDVMVIQMEADLDLVGLFRHIQAKGFTVRTVLLLDVEDTLSTWDLLTLGVDGLVLSNQAPAVLLATIEQLCH